MSQSDTPIKTPSEILAEKIVGALADKKLVVSDDVNKISNNLALGKLKAEDWRMALEKAIDKEALNA